MLTPLLLRKDEEIWGWVKTSYQFITSNYLLHLSSTYYILLFLITSYYSIVSWDEHWL